MIGFQFNSEYDAENFRSFKALKWNNGFFKSAKQRDFYLSRNFDTKSQIIALDAGQFYVSVDAHVRWVDYGRRSFRRVEWVFVFDKFGIVKQIKPKFNYTDDGMSSWFSGEIEVVWERDASIEAPVFEEVAPKTSNHVGVVGQRFNFRVKVAKVRSFGVDFYGNPKFQTVLETASGDQIVYWNLLKYKDALGASMNAVEGDMVEFSASVKEHSEYRGKNQTIISRATKVKVTKGE